MNKNNKLYTLILATLIAATPAQSYPMHKWALNKEKPVKYENVTQCIKDDNLELLKKYITKGLDINKQNKIGRTFLHHAILYDNFKTADILLKNGINPYLENKNGANALIQSVISIYDTKMLQLLLEQGINPDIKNTKGLTALKLSVLLKKLPDIKVLLHYGATPITENIDYIASGTTHNFLTELNKKQKMLSIADTFSLDKIITDTQNKDEKTILNIALQNITVRAALRGDLAQFKLFNTYATKLPKYIIWQSPINILKHLAGKEQNKKTFWLNCFKQACKHNETKNIPQILTKFELSDQEYKQAYNQAKKYNKKAIGRVLISWKTDNKILNNPMFRKNATGTYSQKTLTAKDLKLKNIKMPENYLVKQILAFKGSK